jgi:hypothetical protein
MAGSAKPRSDSEQSLGDLVALATKDLSKLIRYELDLAKSELRSDLRRVAVSGALFGIAAFFGLGILVALFFAYAYLLHEVARLPGGMAAAYGVTAFSVLLVGAVAGFIAYRVIKRMSGMKRTRASVTEGIGMLRRDGERDDMGNKTRRLRGRGRKAVEPKDIGPEDTRDTPSGADGQPSAAERPERAEIAGSQPPR